MGPGADWPCSDDRAGAQPGGLKVWVASGLMDAAACANIRRRYCSLKRVYTERMVSGLDHPP
eukprot:6335677-Pyramimonas_sp.AAC.1